MGYSPEKHNLLMKEPLCQEVLYRQQQMTTTNQPICSVGTEGTSIVSSVILPAYNEALALPAVLDALFATLDACHEVIVVDDGSTDATMSIARQYPCRLLRHRQNRGKGAAVRTGLTVARGRFVIVMDADNTYPVDALPCMIALLEEYDMVRCIRHEVTTSMPLLNQLGNRLFDSTLKFMSGLEGDDHLTGLYGLRRESLDALQFTANGFDLEVEIGIKARAHRLRATTFPIKYHERLGAKKLNPWQDGWRILRRVFVLALLYNPGKTFVVPGMFLWGVAVVLALLLSQGKVDTPFGGLSIHSFLVAVLGVTSGFQIIVFGIAAALYAVESGATPNAWLLWLSGQHIRTVSTLLGMGCALVGGLLLGSMVVQWIASGGGAFYATQPLVLAGMLLSGGMQVMLAALFISIFAGRLERATKPLPTAVEIDYSAS